MKYIFSLMAIGTLVLGISLTASAQTEVSLLVPNPFRGSLDKLIPDFESKTGYKVVVTHGKGLGTRDQVARGEMFDVSILLPPYPEALASGNIDPQSATTLARLRLAVGVKKGATKPPDISTVAGLKQALRAAGTVAYVDPTVGSDGFATREALRKLGELELVESKSKLAASASVAASFVAKGEADLCIFYLNEMQTNPSVDVIGPWPKEFATPVDLVAFISTHARDAHAAKILVEYLSSPGIEAIYKQDGLEPAH